MAALGDSHLKVVSMEVEDKSTNDQMYISRRTVTLFCLSHEEQVSMLLYAKEKYGISDAVYHELSMIFPDLPRSSQVKQKAKKLNEK